MFSIIYITAGSIGEAKSIGRRLIEERLAACANIFPITSIFRWKGKINEENEFVILVKTRTNKVKDVEKRVKQLHSYEIPCLISLKIDSGSDDYLKWIEECVI